MIKTIAKDYGVEANQIQIGFQDYLADGTSIHRDDIKDLDHICEIKKWIDIRFPKSSAGYLSIELNGLKDFFQIIVSADSIKDMNDVFDQFVTAFDLEECDRKVHNSRGDTEKRSQLLEDKILRQNRKMRCFFSYSFDDDYTQNIASKVEQYLSLLNVEVITGQPYEPRKISEKVITKLRDNLDFIVILITQKGESMWTRDEISTAIHRGIPVIPLVENGARFESGLFGDLEFIKFESGHIGDTYLKLLEAVIFIRNESIGAAVEVTTENL